MADFAVNFTPRLVQRYFSGAHAHSHTWRYELPGALVEVKNQLSGFYDTLAAVLSNDARMLDASNYPAGSDISVATDSVSGTPGGSAALSVGGQAFAISFTARSLGGSNFKVSVFGVNFGPQAIPGGNYRIEAGEAANIDNVRAALVACSTLRGIDGEPLVWKPYANYRVDAYWQKKSR